MFNVSFIWRYFDFLIKICFLNGHIIFGVINFCCCLILLFVLTRFLNIGVSQQSSAPSFTPALSYLFWRLSFRSYATFEKKTWVFGFFYVPHLVDNHAKIVDERGRNLMCNLHITESPCHSYVWIHFRELNFFVKMCFAE